MIPGEAWDEHSSDLIAAVKGTHNSSALLFESAGVMRQFAERLCQRDTSAHRQGCQLYHSLWQYWRIAGLTATPNWNAQFYENFFSVKPIDRERRILICGSADYGPLDHVATSIPRALLHETGITVLDLCQTPLQICYWYREWYRKAQGHPLNLTTVQASALDIPFKDESFDLITNYMFLTKFDDGDRRRIIREWHRILKPGGMIATTTRLARPDLGIVVGIDPDEFSSRVVDHVTDHKPWLVPLIGPLGFLAFEYARIASDYAGRGTSLEYLRELFYYFDVTVRSSQFVTSFHETKYYGRVEAVKR